MYLEHVQVFVHFFVLDETNGRFVFLFKQLFVEAPHVFIGVHIFDAKGNAVIFYVPGRELREILEDLASDFMTVVLD